MLQDGFSPVPKELLKGLVDLKQKHEKALHLPHICSCDEARDHGRFRSLLMRIVLLVAQIAIIRFVNAPVLLYVSPEAAKILCGWLVRSGEIVLEPVWRIQLTLLARRKGRPGKNIPIVFGQPHDGIDFVF